MGPYLCWKKEFFKKISAFWVMVILSVFFLFCLCSDVLSEIFTNYHTMRKVALSYKTLFLENNLGLALMMLSMRIRVQNWLLGKADQTAVNESPSSRKNSRTSWAGSGLPLPRNLSPAIALLSGNHHHCFPFSLTPSFLPILFCSFLSFY